MDLIRCKNNKINYFDKIFNVNFPIMINGNHTTNKAKIIATVNICIATAAAILIIFLFLAFILYSLRHHLQCFRCQQRLRCAS